MIFAEMKKNLKRIVPILVLSGSIILGAATIMGGLFQWGIPVGIAVLLLSPLLSIFIVAAGKSLSSEYASLPNHLKLNAFSYPDVPWLRLRESESLDPPDLHPFAVNANLRTHSGPFLAFLKFRHEDFASSTDVQGFSNSHDLL